MIDRFDIHKLANSLAKAAPLILLAFSTFFAFKVAQFQKDNRDILNNTESVVASTSKIIVGLDKAVEDLKEDNEQQTLILCRVILKGNLSPDLTAEEEDEIEGICEIEISRRVSEASGTVGLDNAAVTPPFAFLPHVAPLPSFPDAGVSPQPSPAPVQPSSSVIPPASPSPPPTITSILQQALNPVTTLVERLL